MVDGKLVDALLVDEASMLDVSLGQALLNSLPKGCRLILVGEPCVAGVPD